MSVYIVNFLKESYDGSRFWSESLNRELKVRGYDTITFRYPAHAGFLLGRILVVWSVIVARVKSWQDGSALVIRYPYFGCFIAPFLGKYILHTTDTQHLREVIALQRMPLLKKIAFHSHYWSWRVWLQFAQHTVCNNHYTQELAKGKATVLYDVELDGFSCYKTETEVIFGCLCSKGTENWLDGYWPTLRDFQKDGVKIVILGGTKQYAENHDAIHIPWTRENLRNTMNQWTAGLALLPYGVSMPGKLHGKILQYMVSGIPVVASPQGETTYILGSFLFNADSPENLRRELEYILKNQQVARHIGIGGRIKAQQWTIEKYAEKFIKTAIAGKERGRC